MARLLMYNPLYSDRQVYIWKNPAVHSGGERYVGQYLLQPRAVLIQRRLSIINLSIEIYKGIIIQMPF